MNPTRAGKELDDILYDYAKEIVLEKNDRRLLESPYYKEAKQAITRLIVEELKLLESKAVTYEKYTRTNNLISEFQEWEAAVPVKKIQTRISELESQGE